MAGMLQYGVMKGVGNEWLKQSDEKRKAQLQEIRDNRLAELEQGNIKFRADLTTKENVRQEGVKSEAAGMLRQHETGRDAAKFEHETALQEAEQEHSRSMPHNVPAGAGAIDASGRLLHDQPKTFAPTSGSVAAAKWKQTAVPRLNEAGTMTTFEDLRQEWESLYIDEVPIDPEFPLLGSEKQRKPSSPDLIEYFNSQVPETHRIQANDPRYMEGKPEKLFEYYKSQGKLPTAADEAALIESLKKRYQWWGGPEGSQGKQQVRPGNEGPDAGAPDVKEPNVKEPSVDKTQTAGVVHQGSGGMLTQGTRDNPTVQGGGGAKFTGADPEKDLAKAEADLKELEGKKGRTIQYKKQKLYEKIERLKKTLGR